MGTQVNQGVQAFNESDPAFFAWLEAIDANRSEPNTNSQILVDPTSDDLDLDETGNES